MKKFPEIFKGVIYRAYPYLRASLLYKGVRRKSAIKVISDPSVVAYTDGLDITISDVNSFFTNENYSVSDKVHITNGLIAHEAAHILFTTPRKNLELLKDFADGNLPDAKSFLEKHFPKVMAKAVAEGKVFSEEELVALAHIAMSEALEWQNILEDGYIEWQWLFEIDNPLSDSLKVLRGIHHAEMRFPDLYKEYLSNKDEIVSKAGEESELAVSHLLYQSLKGVFLSYGKYGQYNMEEDEMVGELWENFFLHKEVALQVLEDQRSLERSLGAIAFGDMMLAEHFGVLLSMIETHKQQEALQQLLQQIAESMQQNGGGEGKDGEGRSVKREGSGSGAGSSSSSDEEESGEDAESEEENKEEQEGSSGSASKDDPKEDGEKDADNKQSTPSQYPNEDPNPNSGEEMNPEDGETERGIGCSSIELSPKTVQSLEKLSEAIKSFSVFNEKKMEEMSDEIKKAKKEAKFEHIDTSELLKGIHSGVDLEVERYNSISTKGMWKKFLEESTEFKASIQKITREAKRLLERFSNEVEKRGSYSGSRMDRTSFIRKDRRYFSRTIRPQNKPSIAVSVLIDSSGSTYGDVERYQLFAAMALMEMCSTLNIPFTIKDHYCEGYRKEVVKIGIAKDFLDQKVDKDALFNISAGGSNRDGLAIRYALEELSHRKEEKKIFFIISDGAPAADGYGGEMAYKDIRKTIASYPMVSSYSFGVGEAAPRLSEIYENKFFDCSDLATLEKSVIRILKDALGVF